MFVANLTGTNHQESQFSSTKYILELRFIPQMFISDTWLPGTHMKIFIGPLPELPAGGIYQRVLDFSMTRVKSPAVMSRDIVSKKGWYCWKGQSQS